MKHISLLLLVFIAVAGSANAIQPIPEDPGWSGIVIVGVGGLKAKTNMVAGIDLFSVDIGKDTINSLSNEPETESTAMPQLNLNINYTFSTQTQLFLGNSLEDIVQLDSVSVIGVRQQFSDNSILELSSVSSPALTPVEVWEDPYVVGVARTRTDRTSRGVRIEYDKILGTGFGIQYTHRKTEIDNELSGTTQLGLPAAQAELLKRDGTIDRLVGHYRFPLVGRNQFELHIGRRTDDRDGKAMSGDMDEIKLIHAYYGKRYVIVSNIFYFDQEFDAVNPVFGKIRDDETLGLGFFAFDKKIFKSENWWGQASAIWVEQDSNIDFYDQNSLIVLVGAQYRF